MYDSHSGGVTFEFCRQKSTILTFFMSFFSLPDIIQARCLLTHNFSKKLMQNRTSFDQTYTI
jgi:hypothetical protein